MQALNKCTEGEQNAEDSRDPVSSEAHWGCTQVTEQVVRSGWGVNIGDETAQACSEKCSCWEDTQRVENALECILERPGQTAGRCTNAQKRGSNGVSEH